VANYRVSTKYNKKLALQQIIITIIIIKRFAHRHCVLKATEMTYISARAWRP
jgi:hypothetical protein